MSDDKGIDSMSIKELKALISSAGLSSADCVEKADLRKRAHEARASGISTGNSDANRRSRTSSASPSPSTFRASSLSIDPRVCDFCKKEVDQNEESSVWALQRRWHKEHFCCAQCGNVLDSKNEKEYIVQSNKPYCIDDYYTLFGNTCHRCEELIKCSSYQYAAEGYYHNGCFTCAYEGCTVSFVSPSNQHYESLKSQEIYCHYHHLKTEARLCSSCDKEITGRFMDCKEYKYHDNCYKCSCCNARLANQIVQSKGANLYCCRCFEKEMLRLDQEKKDNAKREAERQREEEEKEAKRKEEEMAAAVAEKGKMEKENKEKLEKERMQEEEIEKSKDKKGKKIKEKASESDKKTKKEEKEREKREKKERKEKEKGEKKKKK